MILSIEVNYDRCASGFDRKTGVDKTQSETIWEKKMTWGQDGEFTSNAALY